MSILPYAIYLKRMFFLDPEEATEAFFRWSNHSLVIHSGHSGLPNTFDMLYGAGTYDLGLLTLKMTQSCRNKCELWVYEWFRDGGNLLRHLGSHISKSFGLGFFFSVVAVVPWIFRGFWSSKWFQTGQWWVSHSPPALVKRWKHGLMLPLVACPHFFFGQIGTSSWCVPHV